MKVKGGDAGLSYVSRQNIPLKKEMTDSQTVVLRPINTIDDGASATTCKISL